MKTIRFYLLITSGICLIAMISTEFHLVTQSKNYSDAKTYCRDFYGDLATVHNLSDMNNLITLASNVTARAWIGLENGGVWMWHWSQPDQKLDYFNWRSGEPWNNSRDGCAAMDGHGKWFESNCTVKRSFICQGGTGGLTLVAEAKTWRDAQVHCRNLLSDLVSINSAEKNDSALRASAFQTVWIGLFKDPWKWTDGSPSSFRYWKPSQPNYLRGQDCVAAVFKDQGKWNDLRCRTRRHFVCRGASQHIPATTSPAGPPQNTTADGTWTHPTVSASTNTTGAPSEAPASSQLTPNATDGVTRSPTTQLDNVTTRPPSEATDGFSAATTVTGAAAPSAGISSVRSENLILIRENLTWIQAMSYCRRHHVDLVHITSRDVQEQVAAIAKKSTSAHVWVGLRYTCQFNVWFWTGSAPSCYQNWAPGQGPQGDYNCGVTGAVQATGGQQWVGLADGERLNFVCSACAG